MTAEIVHFPRSRMIRLVPSGDVWADAITETVMEHYPEAPDCVVEAFTAFVSNYAEQMGKTAPEQMDMGWMWRHFARLSGLASSDGGAA